jgi:hypothetical protein
MSYYVVTQDVGGLSELLWPSGSVIIQIAELSVGWLSVCSNHKEQILKNIEVLLTICMFTTSESDVSLSSRLLATTRQNALSTLVYFS